MAYTVPRVEITQEFVQAPVFANNPLAAFIFGPNYNLYRYSITDEKANTYVGDYVPAGIALKAWPSSQLTVDVTKDSSGNYLHATSYVENAFARYFGAGASGSVPGAVTSGDDAGTSVSLGGGLYATYQVKATHLYFASGVNPTSGAAYTRSDYFSNRDVQIGDWVAVTGNNNYATPAAITIFAQITGVLASSTGEINVLQTAQRIFDVASGSSKTLINPAVGVTIELYLRKSTQMPNSFLLTTLTASQVGVIANATISDPLLVGTNSAMALRVAPQCCVGATLVAAGTGWSANDTFTVVGGTGTATVIKVLAVDAGAILTYEVSVPGSYTVIPTGAVTGTTSGGGSLATFNLRWTHTQPAGKVYVSHRALRLTNAAQIQSLDDPSLVEATLGPVSPENPLAQGVYSCLLNASGTRVYFMAVPTDDLPGYNTVLEQAKRSSNIYGLVPLTFDSTIQTAVKSHVATMSTPAQAKWRKAWLSLQPTTYGILPGYTQAASGTIWQLGAVGADPETGTANRMFTVTSSPIYDPAFVTNGVRVGDVIRIFGSGVIAGNHDDYVISGVRGQNELVVSSAINASGTVITAAAGCGVQIIRYYSKDEQIAMLGAATLGTPEADRRINPVFPDYLSSGGVVMPGYILAAALAGLRAGSLPHRPLSNVEVLGFDDLTETLVTFTSSQLDDLAAYGYWIVIQDTIGGTPYVRHQLTAAGYNEVGADPKFSEDSITTNVDSISFGLQRALAPFMGRYNINPATLALVSGTINRQLKVNMLANADSSSGPQLLGYTIHSLAPSAIFKDRLEGRISLDMPYPLNSVTIALIVP